MTIPMSKANGVRRLVVKYSGFVSAQVIDMTDPKHPRYVGSVTPDHLLELIDESKLGSMGWEIDPRSLQEILIQRKVGIL